MELKLDSSLSTAAGSRSKMMSKSRALSTARSMVHSCLGVAVMKNRTAESAAHEMTLRRIETERLWHQRELRNRSRAFLAVRTRRPGPIIVFDRPPLCRDYTDRVFLFQNRDGLATTGTGDLGPQSRPRYMRSTVASSNHTMPSHMSTLDAFQTVPRARSTIIDKHYCPIIKRRPISAVAATAAAVRAGSLADDVRFRLAVQPSWPLTDQEQDELQAGWQQYWQQMRRSRRARSSSPSPRLTNPSPMDKQRSSVTQN